MMNANRRDLGPDSATILRLFRTMLRIRKFEEAAAQLMASAALPGSLHLSIGQEAVAAGVCDVLDEEDYITTTHRGHGHCIAKGGKPRLMMAELRGRRSGYGGGRAGSMHIADAAVGNLGANAIVGAGLPIALGAAFSAMVRGRNQVAVPFFGEGAVAQGVFHETLNIAALWQLPIVFVCENNQYAEMTPISKHLATTSVAGMGCSYGIPGAFIDGNDVLAVRSATLDAVAKARSGGGPTLLECRTYRWRGHFEGDAQRYRPKEEVESWRTNDPIRRLVDATTARPSLANSFSQITGEVQEEIRSAVAYAAADPFPVQEAVMAHVYHQSSLAAPLGRPQLSEDCRD